jgi:hypothetical protein
MELYWPQTQPLPWVDGGRPLRQSGQPTAILDDIGGLRTGRQAGKATRLDEAKKQSPEMYHETFEKVKRTLVRYPLVLLQTLPGGTDTFLYDDVVAERQSHQGGYRQAGQRDSTSRGVADAMARLAGLLKPTLEYVG